MLVPGCRRLAGSLDGISAARCAIAANRSRRGRRAAAGRRPEESRAIGMVATVAYATVCYPTALSPRTETPIGGSSSVRESCIVRIIGFNFIQGVAQ